MVICTPRSIHAFLMLGQVLAFCDQLLVPYVLLADSTAAQFALSRSYHG